MTFASTYLSRKQLLVDKLASKGVTGHTSSDGLTTLINAIAEIESGSGKILKLISDKTTLSQYDSDVATLTAILLDDGEGVAGEEIKFDFGNGLGVYIDTNEQGVATTTYTSQGSGDLTMSITSDGLISKLKIEDCIIYNKNEYKCNATTKKDIIIADLSEKILPAKFELTAEYKSTGESRFGLFNKETFDGNPAFSVFIGSPDGSRWYYGDRTTSTSTTDVPGDVTHYHTYTIRKNGETFSYNRDDSLTYTKSNNWFNDYNYLIGVYMWSKTSFVKNIKLKAL